MSRNEESDKTVKRSNWDSLLPAAVRYDSRLKGDAKILYSEILLLSNKAGYCYATDQHLAALFSKTRVTINGYVKSLEKHGYIKIETTRQGKRVTERRIYPLELPKTSIFQNDKSVISRDSAIGSKETLTTYGGSKENLTRGSKETLTTGSKKIFTVNDSNSNDSKKELEREQEGQQPAAGILYNGLTWNEKLGSLDGKLKLLLDKYLTSLPVNVIQYAIDKAAKKDKLKSSYGYLNKVLADYQDNGINTIDKLEALNDKRYKQLGLGQLKESDKAAKTSLDQKEIAENRKHGLPDWLSKESRESDIKEQQAKSEKDDIKERSKVHKNSQSDGLPFEENSDKPTQPEPEAKSISEPKTQSISEWQQEQRLKDQQRAISQSETDNRLSEWLDPKLKAAELKERDNQESSGFDDTKSASNQPSDKANNDNQQTGTQPQQDKTNVKDDQPAKANREPRMNQQEQISAALGLAALRKGKQLSSYQIKLLDKYSYELSDKDKQLLAEYKNKRQPSPTANEG